jgi:hypothetical protein
MRSKIEFPEQRDDVGIVPYGWLFIATFFDEPFAWIVLYILLGM